MMQADKYRVLEDGRLLVDYGPITMSITAKKSNQQDTNAAIVGADKAIKVFDELVEYLDAAKSRINKIDINKLSDYPQALKLMIESVKSLNNEEFTPMAAVAGAMSDIVKEEIINNTYADYVVVNNGGDVAFQKSGDLIRNGVFKVGVISDISNKKISHALEIKTNSNIHGIATSGFGGRSLTRGICSAVTVIAENCRLADAAATEIANNTYIDSDKVEVCLAEEIDYDTDIKGLTVVKNVGVLCEDDISKSISLGMNKAIELYNRKIIKGAFIFVQNKFNFYPHNAPYFNINEI